MALSTNDAAIINNDNPTNQKVALGTEIKAIQDAVTNIQAGVGVTLPTSDPGVAGQLWADTLVVKVSAG